MAALAGVKVQERKAAAVKGGLRAFADALVAEKAGKEGGASAPPSAAPPEPPVASQSTGSEPEGIAAFEAQVAKSLGRIAAAARSPGMQGDPYRENFIALAGVVELMPLLVRMVYGARQPISEEATAAFLDGVERVVGDRTEAAVKRQSARWFRSFDRRTTAVVASCVGGAFVLGSLIGFATAFRLLAG